MKKLSTSILLILSIIFAASVSVGSQAWFPDGLQSKGSVTIGEKATADSKAVLDVRSTTKGFLPPRMTTTQRDAIASPPAGLTVYNTTTNKLNQYNGTAWGEVAGSGSSGAQYNTLTNYNFEDTTYSTGWTASGGTLAAAAGTNILFGTQSATWDSSSAGQTLSYDAITIGQGYKGNNCEGAIYVQTPSGTATHLIEVYDGTNVLVSGTVITSTTSRQTTVNFPCPSSGTMQLRLKSVAADEPLIAVDDAYLGLARNVGSTQLSTEPVSYTPTIGLTGGTTSASAKWQRIGPDIEVWGDVTFTTVFTGGTATVSLPSVCTIDTTKFPTTPATGVGIIDSKVYFYDVGSGQYGGTVTYNDTSSVLLRTLQDDVGAGGNHVFADATVTTLIPFTWANNDRLSFKFKVPCVGWTAQTIVMPDAQGWYVDATIAGANIDLGTSNVASYSEMSTGSLTMTPRTGSAAAGIMCNSTNAAATPTTSTSTCSVGSESVGINASIPRSGAYEVCASFSHYTEADQGEGVNTAFQLVRTATNAQTILEEGGSRTSSRNAPLTIASGTAQAMNFPYNTCGIFQLSAGVNGFRLMYEQLVTGTPNGSQVLADALSTVGQRDVRFTIKPVSQQQQAILANSVNTRVKNGITEESSTFTCSGSSSIGTQLGGVTWLSSIGNISSGVCAVVFAAGTPASTPQCFATWSGGGSNSMLYTYSETATGFNIGGVTDTGGNSTSFTGKVTCKWAR